MFEQSAILPAGETLSPREALEVANMLARSLGWTLDMIGHRRHEVNFEQPFEHVIGDDQPPDENGVRRLSPVTRSIDL